MTRTAILNTGPFVSSTGLLPGLDLVLPVDGQPVHRCTVNTRTRFVCLSMETFVPYSRWVRVTDGSYPIG
jgi:hypothetical protein